MTDPGNTDPAADAVREVQEAAAHSSQTAKDVAAAIERGAPPEELKQAAQDLETNAEATEAAAASAAASLEVQHEGPSVEELADLIKPANARGERMKGDVPEPTVADLLRTIVPGLSPHER